MLRTDLRTKSSFFTKLFSFFYNFNVDVNFVSKREGEENSDLREHRLVLQKRGFLTKVFVDDSKIKRPWLFLPLRVGG